MFFSKKVKEEELEPNKNDSLVFDLDQLDDDFGMTLDRPGGRTQEFGRQLMSSLTGRSSQRNILRGLITGALPPSYNHIYRTAEDTWSAVKDNIREARERNADTLLDLSLMVERQLPKLKNRLPGRAYEKLERKVQQKRDEFASIVERKRGSEETADPAIDEMTSAMAEMAALTEAKREERDENAFLKQQVFTRMGDAEDAERFRANFHLLQEMRDDISRQTGYQSQVTAKYHQKSIELSYRQYFALRDIRRLMAVGLDMSRTHSETIIHNTSLTDTQKPRNAITETPTATLDNAGQAMKNAGVTANNFSYANTIRRNLANEGFKKYQATIPKYTAEFFPKIQANIQGMLSDYLRGISTAGQLAENFADGPSMSAGQAGQMGGDIISDLFGRYIAPRLGSRFQGQADRLGERFNGKNYALSYGIDNASSILNDFGHTYSSDDGFVKRTLRQLVRANVPEYRLNNRLEDASYQTINEATSFNHLSQRSLVEIIPGYLSRLLHVTQKMYEGRDDVERETYDITKGQFTTVSQARNALKSRIVNESQRENIDATLTDLIKTYQGDETLSQRATLLFRDQLMREAGENGRFDPETLARGEYGENVDPQAREELMTFIRRRFDFDEDGNLQADLKNYKRRDEFSREFTRLRDVMPNSREEITRIHGAGSQEILRDLGIIHSEHGMDHISYQRLWALYRGDDPLSVPPGNSEPMRPTETAPKRQEVTDTPEAQYDAVDDIPTPTPTTSVPSAAFTVPEVSTDAPTPKDVDQPETALDRWRAKRERLGLPSLHRSIDEDVSDVTPSPALQRWRERRAQAGLPPLHTTPVAETTPITETTSREETPLESMGKLNDLPKVRLRDRILSLVSPKGNATTDMDTSPGNVSSTANATTETAKPRRSFRERLETQRPTGEGIQSFLDEVRGHTTKRSVNDTVTNEERRSLRRHINSLFETTLTSFKTIRNNEHTQESIEEPTVTTPTDDIIQPVDQPTTTKRRFSDLFTSSNRKILMWRDIRAGRYTDVGTGKVIESIDDITGPVVDEVGNEAISQKDFDDGIFDVRGETLFTRQRFGRPKDAAETITDTLLNEDKRKESLATIRSVRDRIIGMKDKLFKERKPLLDAYIPGEDSPRIKANDLIKGRYSTGKGKRIYHFDDVADHDVLDENLNVVVSYNELEFLVDALGNKHPLAKNRTIRGNINRMARNMARGYWNWTKNYYKKLPGRVLKAANKLAIKPATKLGLGALGVKDWFYQNDTVKKAAGAYGKATANYYKDLPGHAVDAAKPVIKAGSKLTRAGRWLYGTDTDGSVKPGSIREKKQRMGDRFRAGMEVESPYTTNARPSEQFEYVQPEEVATPPDERIQETPREEREDIPPQTPRKDADDVSPAEGIRSRVKPKRKRFSDRFFKWIKDDEKDVHPEAITSTTDALLNRINTTLDDQHNGEPRDGSWQQIMADREAEEKRRRDEEHRQRGNDGEHKDVFGQLAGLFGGIGGALSGLKDMFTGGKGDTSFFGGGNPFGGGGNGRNRTGPGGRRPGWFRRTGMGLGGLAGGTMTGRALRGLMVGGRALSLFAGGLAMTPVGAGILAGTAVIGGGYYLWKRHKQTSGVLLKHRMAQYGIDPTERSEAMPVLSLESALEEVTTRGAGDSGIRVNVNNLDVTKILDEFGIQEGDEEAMANFREWLNNRFMPAWTKHQETLGQLQSAVPLVDVDEDLEAEKRLEFLESVHTVTGEVVNVYTSPFADGRPLRMTDVDINRYYQEAKEAIEKDIGDKRPDGPIAAADVKSMADLQRYGAQQRQARREQAERDGTARPSVRQALETRAPGEIAGITSRSHLPQATSKGELSPIQKVRLFAYGLSHLDDDYADTLLTIEDMVFEHITFDSDKQAEFKGSPDTILSEHAEALGVAWNRDFERTRQWRTWFTERFLPVILQYAGRLRQLDGSARLSAHNRNLSKDHQLAVMHAILGARYRGWIRRTPVWDIAAPMFVGHNHTVSLEKAREVVDELINSSKAGPTTSSNTPSSEVSNQSNASSGNKPPESIAAPGVFSNEVQEILKGLTPANNPADMNARYNDLVMGGTQYGNGVPGITPPMLPPGGGGQTMGPNGAVYGDVKNGSGGAYSNLPMPAANKSREAAMPVLDAVQQMTGVDANLLATFAHVESRFDYAAKPKTSQATGWFQFIPETWRNVIREYGGQYGIPTNLPDAQIQQLRLDPRINALMGAELLKENHRALTRSLNRAPTDTDLYLAHFLGAGRAGTVLNTPNTSAIAAQLYPDAARSNKWVFYKDPDTLRQPKTVAEIIQWADEKMAPGRTGGARMTTSHHTPDEATGTNNAPAPDVGVSPSTSNPTASPDIDVSSSPDVEGPLADNENVRKGLSSILKRSQQTALEAAATRPYQRVLDQTTNIPDSTSTPAVEARPPEVTPEEERVSDADRTRRILENERRERERTQQSRTETQAMGTIAEQQLTAQLAMESYLKRLADNVDKLVVERNHPQGSPGNDTTRVPTGTSSTTTPPSASRNRQVGHMEDASISMGR